MSASEGAATWYTDGLLFACNRCGDCCTGAPGNVWVSEQECRAIAEHLRLDYAEFTERHVRRVGTRLSLLEKKGGDCEFLVRERPGLTSCLIHPVLPVQCRTWPFWASNLRSPKAWEHIARNCPGMNNGPCHPLDVIQAALQANGDLPL